MQKGMPKGKTKGAPFDDSWSGFLRHLKQWAQSKQLSFELQDGDRPGDDMRQRETNKKKEKMSEGYHAVNQKTSYNDNIPNVKVVIQHDRAVQEGEQRWRNVHKIFVENTEGERFAVPTRMPGIARVYGRHVAEGGTPYDDRGKHITSLVEEYTQMAGFVRATRKGQFNESVALLIAEGVNHHKKLKESLQKMQSHRGYNHYFESWTPPLMEDDCDSSSIAEMFTQGAIDPRIESVLPILNRLNSGIINEIEEVSELDQWAKGITEITEEVIEEEEKRDTHCSAKCCGADVKAEDCGCSPDCEHCNCNKKKLDENPLVGMAARAVVGSAVKDNMEEEKLDEVASDFNHLQDEFDQLISDLKQKHQSDEALQAAIEALLSQYIKKIKDFKNIESTEKQYALGMAGRLQDYLEDEFNGNYSGSKFQGDAISAAGLQAKMELEKERNKSSRTSDRDKSAIGRAIAGVMGLAEFQERDYDDERWEDEPEKFNPKLVDKKTGQEVKLPYTTKDFRGDEVIVVGFNAPKHQASTGRIHTDDGFSYFPSVVGLKIVGHEFDDNLNEGRMKEIVHDAQEMDKEEFEEKYGDDYDYNEIKKERHLESTLFITEGDSASGSITKSRDVNTQAVFSLKGKPLNSYGLSKKIVYENEEFNLLQAALNIEDGLEDLRYNNIVIATDADVDGMHIRLLLITFFLQFFPELIKEGHLYILETPLFRVRNKKQTYYCYSEEEKRNAIEKLKGKPEITRFKGLGEISPNEFVHFIGDDIRLDPVMLDKEMSIDQMLQFYMGKNTPDRQKFIIENLKVELDIVEEV